METSLINKNNDLLYFWVLPISIIIALGFLNLYSAPLFHFLAESVFIFVVLMTTLTVLLTRVALRNRYLLWLGAGYFWVAVLDILHTITYDGIQLVSVTGLSITVQVWIAARLVEILVLLAALSVLYVRSVYVSTSLYFIVVGLVSLTLATLIFQDQFPVMYLPDIGLTKAKILFELLIMAALLLIMYLQWRKRDKIDTGMFQLLFAAAFVTFLSEGVFTLYDSPDDFSLILGHQFKLLSGLLLFLAIIRVLLIAPFRAMGESAQSFDILPDAVLLLDEQYIVRQANNAALQLAEKRLGRKAGKVIGSPVHDIYHSQFKTLEDCPVCTQFGANSQSAIEYFDDKTSQYFSISISKIGSELETPGTLIMARDISPIKEQQNRIQNIYRELDSVTASIRDMLCRVNLGGKVMWGNDAFNLFAREAIAQPRLLDYKSLIVEEDQNRLDVIMDHARLYNQATGVVRMMQGDDLRPFELSISPVYNERSSIKGFTVLARDATEQFEVQNYARKIQTELEEKIEARTRALESTNQELEAFAYSVSHDLRAPVRRISSFAQLLENARQKLDKGEADYLDRIIRSANDMNQLIDALLQLSRYARHATHAEEIDLSEMAREVIAELSAEHPDQNVAVEIEPGLAVFADKILMRVVLTNLLSNAWKYSARCYQPQIRFQKIFSEKVPGKACFCVSDNGIGFEAQYADRVFNAFQRLTSRDDYEGIGIGLATVKRAISRQNGIIWAESEPEQGARFYFTVDMSNQPQD